MRKRKQINRLVASMLCSLVAMSALSQSSVSPRPRLVVGITIDQLRSDYLELLQEHFSTGGFKRLMQHGAYFENVKMDIARPDGINSIALIYTGAYPNVNGITAATTFNEESGRLLRTLNDPKYIGNATDETLSPMALRVSTLS